MTDTGFGSTGKIMVLEPHITIEYDIYNDLLYANWTGNQTKESVMDGCEKILFYLKQEQCPKILNDNTHVTSIWSDASEWVALDWFPRLHKAGCQFFAWVYSQNHYSKLSTDLTLQYDVRDVITITFQSRDSAEAWLRALR